MSSEKLFFRHIEAQTDYFGKKGMSYHVTHAQTKKNGRIAQHLLYHVITTDQQVSCVTSITTNTNIQDSVAVVQIIRHTLEELKKVGIKAVNIRSDNAGELL